MVPAAPFPPPHTRPLGALPLPRGPPGPLGAGALSRPSSDLESPIFGRRDARDRISKLEVGPSGGRGTPELDGGRRSHRARSDGRRPGARPTLGPPPFLSRGARGWGGPPSVAGASPALWPEAPGDLGFGIRDLSIFGQCQTDTLAAPKHAGEGEGRGECFSREGSQGVGRNMSSRWRKPRVFWRWWFRPKGKIPLGIWLFFFQTSHLSNRRVEFG